MSGSEEATQQIDTANESTAVAQKPDMTGIPAIVYYLQLAGFIFGITFIVAMIFDYAMKDSFDSYFLQAHRDFQLKTFWWSALGMAISVITFYFVIGWFIGLVVVIWTLYRVILGLVRFKDGKRPR